MRYVLPCLCLIAIVSSAAVAQDDDVLLYADFETDVQGFITGDPLGEVALNQTADQVHKGKGSLELWFAQRAMTPGAEDQGLPGSVIMPLSASYPDLRGISFALRTEEPTTVGVMLAEGDNGPRYTRLIRPNAGEWTEFYLGLDEFQRDISSAVDPDGRPTPDKIGGVVLIDLDCFFRSLEATGMFQVGPPQEQLLYLDEFKLLKTAPERGKPEENTIPVNGYEPPLTGVALFGGEAIQTGFDEGMNEGKCLSVTYTMPGKTLFALAHQLPRTGIAGAKALQIRMKSEKPGTLIIILEEQSAPGDDNKCSYSATVALTGADAWQTIRVEFSGFKTDANQTDPNGKLDLEHVQMIMLADPAALMSGADATNTLWLDDICAMK